MNVVLTCITRLVPRKWRVQTRKRMQINEFLTVSWKNPGDIAFYKDIADSEGWGANPKHTDRFVEKENVFTLGTVNFGYEFRPNICSKIGVRNLRVGVNLTDIVRWSNVKIEQMDHLSI